MKIIQVPLSKSGIEKAISELKEYRYKVASMAEMLADRLCAEGEQIALLETADIRMTGDLRKSIMHDTHGKAGFVACKCGYAVFVEFGTGVKGRAKPHPDVAILGWSYDVNNHGELGWWYPTDESDTNPTKRRGKDGGLYAWTKGMPSRPFMYNTAEQMRSLIIPIAKELLK
ncbi:MAG: hypothetical protein E7485_08440 [Ruminococcaceae bacterium]|nr:hypothetical protein [Oscillospiraceae bacterium]